MKWKKYTIDTTSAAEDIISAMLAEKGIEGIEIEDKIPLSDEDLSEMFVDIAPEMGPDDGTARIHFYMDEDEDEAVRAARLKEIREELEELAVWIPVGTMEITEGETNEVDWRDNWKQYFHSFSVGDILIKPTWEDTGTGGMRYVISIDPGAAFGTGSHETTKLCIRQMRRYMDQGDRVMDVGTGSGILSIVALKTGAHSIYATDLDPVAVSVSAENIEQNGFGSDRYRIVKGNIIDDPVTQEDAGGGYDLVVANILAPAIIALQGMIFKFIRKGGYFISSGIIDTKEDEVLAALEANPEFDIVEVEHDGEWVGITARRR